MTLFPELDFHQRDLEKIPKLIQLIVKKAFEVAMLRNLVSTEVL